MLTYWKITFTIGLLMILAGAVTSLTRYKAPVMRDLLTLGFITFVVIGMAFEVLV